MNFKSLVTAVCLMTVNGNVIWIVSLTVIVKIFFADFVNSFLSASTPPGAAEEDSQAVIDALFEFLRGFDLLSRESGGNGNDGVGNGEDPQPPGNPPMNDGPGAGPGNPGNQGGANGN